MSIPRSPLPPPRRLFNYKTNGGLPLSLEWREDIEEENRGYVVHRVTARMEAQHCRGEIIGGASSPKVGRLNIIYVPEERLSFCYDRALRFVTGHTGKLRGWPPGKKARAKLRAGKTERELLEERAIEVDRAASRGLPGSSEKIRAMSSADLQTLVEEQAEKIERKYDREYGIFKEMAPLPVVDFIIVKETERRRGIAKALYEAGARELARSKGLSLMAGTLQSDEAKNAWEKGLSNLPLRRVEDARGQSRLCIDYSGDKQGN